MEEDYNADELANQLMTSLLAGENLDIVFDPLPEYSFDFGPTNPIFANLTRVSNEDLTEATLEGNGTFDVMMRAFKVHLREEYDSNRITGAEYAKVYVQLTAAAMSNAVQFLLGKDQAFWAAANAQIAAANNLTELAIAKMKYQVAQIEVKNGRAAFALTKLKLASEAHTVGIAKFQLTDMLPTQKDLYLEQITSYKADAKTKVAKIFSDAWITQKTVDEGLLAPAQFTNDEINEALTALKVFVDLGT